MSTSGEPRIEYVEARRVLLDALTALGDHLDAVVLVGAQAVYLRTQGRLPGYQAFTTDADLVIDPDKLQAQPPMGRAMADAGFVLTAEPGIWEARFERPGFADEIVVPVDLIVPDQLAPRAGRRAARLPGEHGKATARKGPGLEGAVVDNDHLTIAPLEASDARQIIVNVAGVGALWVAKMHKLGDRFERPERLHAKDAGDVYRLIDGIDVAEMAHLLRVLLADERSAAATQQALAYARRLFVTPAGPGVELAAAALRGVIPPPTVTAVLTAYTRRLIEVVGR